MKSSKKNGSSVFLLVILALALLPASSAGAKEAEPPASYVRSIQVRAASLLREQMEPNPVVQGMLQQVNQPELTSTLEYLTGERSISLDGGYYTLNSRFSMSATPIQKATQYAYDTFQALGLKTTFDPYTLLQQALVRNVIAEQTGLTQPERIFLVTAHIDSTSNLNPYQNAPGADDNASGSVAVMTAARLLSQYDFGCTIRYALFTGEEQGLYGSAAYASDVKQLGEDVEGVLNLDMLAYNTPNTSPTMEIHTRKGNAGDMAIANQFVSVVQTYSLNLIPLLLQDGERASDHAAFWDRGYPAVMVIEDWTDHTPYYHRTQDKLDSLNLDYYSEMVKAAVATMGHMGCLLDGLVQGRVHGALPDAPLAGARVEAWQSGNLVRFTTTAGDGSYEMPLLAGIYQLKVSAAGHQAAGQDGSTVSVGQSTRQDFNLESCATVQSPDFQFAPLNPSPGQLIVFNASISGGQEPVRYAWTFGDSGTGDGMNISHTFSQPGAYPVNLTTDNICGYPQTVSRNLLVGVNVLYLPILLK
jgi:hypothetical protein